MNWLNAMLAFALAMIVFCTIVSAVTEFVQHLWGHRQDGLKWMLERFYDEVITTRLQTGALARENFLDTLTSNLSAPASKKVRLTALSYQEFANRFARTDAGRAVWEAIKQQAGGAEDQIKQSADALIGQLAQQFARFEADATAYFAQRARSITIGVAIVVAFALNIDAVRLFSSFMADQQLTQRLLARAEKITAVPAAPGGAAATIPAAAPVAPPDPSGPQKPARAADPSGITQQLEETSALGLPIGSRYFPWCTEPSRPDAGCLATGGALVLQYVRWFAVTLLTGLLIGLGGPFWFDVYSKVSATISALRGSGLAAGAPRDQTSGTPGTPADAVAAAAQAFRDAAR